MNKPSIISVIGERIDLRKAGKEWVGICAFHAKEYRAADWIRPQARRIAG